MNLRTVAFSGAVFLCGCAEEEPKPGQPEDGSSPDHDASGGTSADDTHCPANDLVASGEVEVTYDPADAPSPQGGTIPITGTFELVQWTVFGTDEGPSNNFSSTYRFREDKTIDIISGGMAGSMTWMLEDGKLFLQAVCPEELVGIATLYEYSMEGDTFTLFTDDGVLEYEKK